MPVERHVRPEASAGYALKRLQQAIRARMDRQLAGLGLSAPQYAVLALLSVEPGISSAELARRAFVTPQTMIRIVRVLERADLIERASNARDARLRSARLTARGTRVLERAAPLVEEIERSLRTGLDAGGMRQLLGWMNAAAARMEEST